VTGGDTIHYTNEDATKTTVHSGTARQSGVFAAFVVDQSTAVENGPKAMVISINHKALLKTFV